MDDVEAGWIPVAFAGDVPAGVAAPAIVAGPRGRGLAHRPAGTCAPSRIAGPHPGAAMRTLLRPFGAPAGDAGRALYLRLALVRAGPARPFCRARPVPAPSRSFGPARAREPIGGRLLRRDRVVERTLVWIASGFRRTPPPRDRRGRCASLRRRSYCGAPGRCGACAALGAAGVRWRGSWTKHSRYIRSAIQPAVWQGTSMRATVLAEGDRRAIPPAAPRGARCRGAGCSRSAARRLGDRVIPDLMSPPVRDDWHRALVRCGSPSPPAAFSDTLRRLLSRATSVWFARESRAARPPPAGPGRRAPCPVVEARTGHTSFASLGRTGARPWLFAVRERLDRTGGSQPRAGVACRRAARPRLRARSRTSSTMARFPRVHAISSAPGSVSRGCRATRSEIASTRRGLGDGLRVLAAQGRRVLLRKPDERIPLPRRTHPSSFMLYKTCPGGPRPLRRDRLSSSAPDRARRLDRTYGPSLLVL